MSTLERSCTVKMNVDQAEKCWTDFVGQQGQTGSAAPQGKGQAGGQNPGTVYFNDAGNGQTQVTMQLDPDGITEGDDKTFTQRVDGFLNKFKQFVESR
jgi:hypothetical protein